MNIHTLNTRNLLSLRSVSHGKPKLFCGFYLALMWFTFFAVPSFGAVLDRSDWIATASSSDGGSSPQNALDGNISTRWSSGQSQANGQWFQVDMGNWPAPTFDKIVLDAATSSSDYPRSYQANVSTDGINWGSPVATGNGSSAVTTITFPAQTARYIRITQTGNGSLWWSIHELNVYGTRLPRAPVSLAALPGNAQVKLGWSIGADASTYNVKRGTTKGGPYTLIQNGVTTTNYIDSNVTNNLTYYYVVSGVSLSGESSSSVEAFAMPTYPPIYTNTVAGNWSVVTWLPNPPGQPSPTVETTNVFANTQTIDSQNDLGNFTFNQLLFTGASVNLQGDPLTFDGDSPLMANQRGYAINIANNINLNQGTTIVISANTTALNGVVAGGGGIIKNGAGTLVLSDTNTFSGGTIVSNGIMMVSPTGTFGQGDVSVASNATCVMQNPHAVAGDAYVHVDGGMVNLDYSGTNKIGRLYIDGELQPAGVWNAATDGTHFSGAGSLESTEKIFIPDIDPWLDSYDVNWTTPGPTFDQSMPIGNGDIGLNVWVETNGDLNFYIGKSDAWSDNVYGDLGLYKVGGVRISLNPRPAVTSFLQVLKLRTGEILIKENAAIFRVWVDANNPVIRVEVTNTQPVSVIAALNNWRSPGPEDITESAQGNRVVWYHRNSAAADPHVANLTFGAAMLGGGFTNQDDSTLVSASPAKSQVVSIYPLTAQTDTVGQWQTQLDNEVAEVDGLNLEQTREAHQVWWDQFWHRSWVFVRGDQTATNVTRGYILQRFVTACAGRGAYPIKFNGSLFTVANPSANRSPDSRAWGGQYWFQNTRAMYWPRLMAGDFDMMQPLFKMYQGQVAPNAAQVMAFYGHQGSYFAETAPFWGGLSYQGPDAPANYTAHYFTPIIELSMMMLDYYEYTGDSNFAKDTLVPVASAGLKFFDQHFGRDTNGKLLLDPDNSIETFWKVHDPAPDIAGLQAVLTRMLALPDNIVSAESRSVWSNLLQQLPPLPEGTKGGKAVLLSYTGSQTNSARNGENPELYAVYPFRLYGIGRPDLQKAIDTFNVRSHTQAGCWVQDPIQAAMLGLASVAKSYVTVNFTASQDPAQKFPAFWEARNDYAPDEDNGGNGENGLQQMLMQIDGKKIFLLPAWPAGWDGDFKLHAPYETTVQGSIVQGRITNLVVTPTARRADVIDMSALSSGYSSGYNMLSPQDAIEPLRQTTAGGPNVFAVSGVDYSANESAGNIIDGNVSTKYFNKAQDGTNALGVNTGFVVTPQIGATVINGFEIATANDEPSRDPFTITIEGSNATNADRPGGNGFTLIYSGTTGLFQDPGRNSWGLFGNFVNTNAYKAYRVLIKETSGGGAADGVQYSEIKLLGKLSEPLPGTNVLSSQDVVAPLKETAVGEPNVLAVSGTDFSASESAGHVKDGDVNTKYYNRSQDGSNPRGVNTGFVITPQAGYTIINGLQFATANDMPTRDPTTITIEGSNDSNAIQAGNSAFTLIWAGPSGIFEAPGRKSWAQVVNFANDVAYKSYRILVTETAGGGGSDGTQYSEVKLLGGILTAPAAPEALNAVSGNAKATLSWAASASASSYNIKRSVNGGSYSILTNVTKTNFTDTGLTNGTTYSYRVTAVNAVAESADSLPASVTPVAPLPLGVMIVPGNQGNQLQLSWPTNGHGDLFGVYYASNLNLPTIWQPVADVPVLSKDQWVMTLTLSSGEQRFYRLQD